MGYYTFRADREKWTARKGLEGPFFYANGRVLYYDPKQGAYWDPTCDWYVSNEEVHDLQNDMLKLLRKAG